ncbi:hypothetical protein Leryth_016887, partial [Lithospermum erythrorhizon]
MMANEMKKQDLAISSIRMEDNSQIKKRLYQVWEGRNKFLCGGRLIFGPDGRSVIISSLLIGAPSLTFCIHMLVRKL